jgi:hypothetical protein
MFGQIDGEIESYRTTLIRLRDDFLALAAVTTEVAVLGMQHDVRKMQGDVSNVQDGVSKIQVDVSNHFSRVRVFRLIELTPQLMAISSQTSEAGANLWFL